MIINDGRDETKVTCEVQDFSAEIQEIYIDLSILKGPEKQNMEIINTNDGTAEFYTYFCRTNFTVPHSISEGEYILKIHAVNLDGRMDNNYFKLNVRENTPPIITDYQPSNLQITINESERIDFSINAFDLEDGDNLNYNWYLNSNLLLNNNRNRYSFITDFTGDQSAGSYTINVIISDSGFPNKTVELEWKVEVLNILSDFEIREKELQIQSHNVTVNQTLFFTVIIHNMLPAPENNVTVHLIQLSTNRSIPDSVYSTYNIKSFQGNSFKILDLSWLANESYHYLKVWVDPENKIIELSEDNNFIVIPVNVSQPEELPPESPIIDHDDPSSEMPVLVYLIIIVNIIIIITIYLVIGTEFGQYQFFLLLAPYYSRVTGDRILEHKLRSRIYSYIQAHPGAHYRSIMDKLKIKNGTLVHHLARLEHEELIKSERDGYFKRFYPVGMRIPRSEVGIYYPEGMATYNIGEHQVSGIQLRILRILKKEPGLTQKEIAQKIKESRRVVNYHIKLLEQHDLIRVEKSGRETQCFIIDKYLSSS